MRTAFLIALFAVLASAYASAETFNNPPQPNIYQFANQCYQLYSNTNQQYLGAQAQEFAFSHSSPEHATQVYMRPAALGIYLLYTEQQAFLIAENQKLIGKNTLDSEMTLNLPETDYLLTPAEWQLHGSTNENQFVLQNLKSKLWLGETGLVEQQNQATAISFVPGEHCAVFPESETGAQGKIQTTHHADGMLWGFVDAHEHSGANHGFGGKVFHGASFHKLGIEHALADCEKHHGKDGSKDLINIMYQSGAGNISFGEFVKNLYAHLVKNKPNHATEGFPEMDSWNAHQTATHQSLYYKWIERAYLGGMRLMVEYMESTEVVCKMNQKLFPSAADVETCNEMAHVDHQITKMLELQDYIDAQNGGPGAGWLRIVYSPAEARDVIAQGKLAVILGIEIENPLDCFINEREGFESCSPRMVRDRLHNYYGKGVRALFPSHKFRNAFSSGDGDAGILELGDYLNNGEWRDYVACEDVKGDYLGSHNEGKEASLFTKLGNITGVPTLNRWLSGEHAGTPKQVLPIYPAATVHCQRDGFTPLGISLINEMMQLGMIIDLGHTPKAALSDVLPILVKKNYPAVHTHGGDQTALNLIGGLNTQGLGETCRDEQGDSQLKQTFREILAQVDTQSGLPRKGLSYDFNGLAGYAKPRFGTLSRCETQQHDQLEYPFKSFDGDIEFEPLRTGNRVYDFNTDGLANIGLYPDLIEEARRSGVSDKEIEALFRTAEAYIQIWERAYSFRK